MSDAGDSNRSVQALAERRQRGLRSVWAYEIVSQGIAEAVFVIYILTMYF